MSFKNILFETKDGIATITFNRPEFRNALNKDMYLGLKDALDQSEADTKVRVIVLTGAGNVFSSGADMEDMIDMKDQPVFSEYVKFEYDMFSYVEESVGKPVIAVLNGHAMGAALELALACDFRIAAENAKFGFAEPLVGYVSPMQRISRLIGIAKTKEMTYTGKIISAKEAEQIGLVNKAVPTERLKDEVSDLAKKMMAIAPLPLKFAKRSLLIAYPYSQAEFEYENQSQALCYLSEDVKEGLAAFKEKRKANFKGR